MTETTSAPKRLYTLAYVTAAALVGLVLGVLIAWAFFIDAARSTQAPAAAIPNLSLAKPAVNPQTVLSTRKSVATSRITSSGELIVEDQPAGLIVHVRHAAVDEGKWVVIHEDREGILGNVLGAARFVRGTTEGAVELLRATSPGSTYHAVLYADNGDRAFSLSDDTPLSDVSGTIKGVTFSAY